MCREAGRGTGGREGQGHGRAFASREYPGKRSGLKHAILGLAWGLEETKARVEALQMSEAVSAALGEYCQAYLDPHSKVQPAKSCPSFCCGDCTRRYCCSNSLFRFDEEQQLMCNLLDGRTSDLGNLNLLLDSEDLSDYGPSFGTLVAIGITVFAVIVITIILCLTCSCCCLYKACRKPRPVVTTTTATTVVHAAYPQPGVPPSYPVAPYQGYQPMPIQPQPGMPAAPYPTQYPPPYPMQPSGPPAYHETVAAGAGAPYPISQPPYNPAYMDPQKPTY